MDEVIIGLDFLFDQGMEIDMNKRIMKNNNMEVPFGFGYDGPYSSKRVILEESEQIPPSSEAVVWAKIDGDCGTKKLRVVEPTENSTPDVLIGKTLAKTQKDGRIPVRVLNEFKLPIKLRRGTVLGQCREVEPIFNCEKLPESDSIGENDIGEDINAWTEGLEEKYSNIFDKDGNKPGRTNVVKHRIDTGDARPIRQAPRSVPLSKRETVSQIIKESEIGVIGPSASPWRSPVVLVEKKSETK
ncbi:PREDICTED: uncharacterized protein LOC108367285 [Rhagoletis zephyria]|uniref:uncharacterized protein LOC108367285 n=1 Tax=Rhagoletis zephyria TaxID=28612 RepID=UPI000811A0E9|nr:PREDICTED: uncharacterized protein LOC108367285 [Rhagoletis zephyria]